MANQSALFPLTPVVSWGTVTTANTTASGTGTISTCFTAGNSGARIDQVSLYHLGTNPSGVVRLFINNGLTNATTANNSLWNEVTMSANSVSQISASVPVVFYPSLVLPSGYNINMTAGTTMPSGIQCTIQGGNY